MKVGEEDMQIDKMIRTLVIVCLVLAGTLAVGFIFQGRARGEDDRQQLAAGFEPSKVVGLEIRNATGQFTLLKENEGWYSSGTSLNIAVRTPLVEEVLNWLEKAKTIRTVSPDGSGADALGFSSSSTQLRLRDSAGAELGILTLGSRSQTGQEVYARWGENPAIFSLEPGIEVSLERSPLDWADKRLWPSNDESLVLSFSVESRGSREEFVRASDGQAWSGKGSDLAEKSTATEITPLLRQILTLEGTSIMVQGEAERDALFASLEKVFTLELNNGQSLWVRLYQKPGEPEGDYYVDSSWPRLSKDGKHSTIIIPSWRVGDLKIR